MHVETKQFARDSAAAVQNKTLQNRLRVLNSFTIKRDQAFANLPNGEALRDRAREIKRKVINNLDTYLLQLEENVKRNGGNVHWARNDQEALEIVLEIARANNVKTVVKSKSMVTEEIELNDELAAIGVEAIETDAHGLREAKEMTVVAREKLRQKFCSADMGVTGANFAIAETGTIVLVEN